MIKSASRNWLWIGAGALGGVALARWQLARWFTQQPRYELEQQLGAHLEIRIYGACWVAETTVSDVSWEQALDEGVRRLGRYIRGDNRPSPFQPDCLGSVAQYPKPLPSNADDRNGSGYVIPMPAPTVPRFAARRERIAMTLPLSVTTHADRSYTIALNLPEGRTLASLPSPNDEQVRLERRPRRRMAVLSYRGRHSGAEVAQKFSELLTRVRRAGIAHRGSPAFARYDAPSTLPFLRHNEVWLELESN